MNTQVKINHTEPLYTLSEARDILAWEQCKRKEVQRKKHSCFIKQRVCGIIMILLSMAILFLLHYDIVDPDSGGAFYVCLLIGLWLSFTRQQVMIF